VLAQTISGGVTINDCLWHFARPAVAPARRRVLGRLPELQAGDGSQRLALRVLVAVRDGVVLFRNFGGEPRIARTEPQRNPLGPQQPAGEAVGGLIVK
jgi:hypothetical protein